MPGQNVSKPIAFAGASLTISDDHPETALAPAAERRQHQIVAANAPPDRRF
ncbi:hypothetical protein [Oricola nitratireducens]|uniref:hypothetical protein n=1 Tax=Oricola nitratireducens TaxID=2775868 RepID=UPI0018689399|nr:hypothetical protein [Oricola nitratireducens]